VDAVAKFNGRVVMTSPGIKSGSDRVAAVAEQVEGDIFVNVQGDEPLIAPEMIDEAVCVLLDDPHAAVGTLVKEITSESDLINPNIVKVVFGADRYALYFSRSVIPWIRDSLDPLNWLRHHLFYKHIGLYAFRKEFLAKYTQMPESPLEKAERLEQLRILENGYTIKIGITKYDSIPIDTQEDVDRVIGILQSR
jgi:3-deoxy-manno-octulosonate cytidylyltransferase (CMP-KDO synthetase)